MQKHRKKPSETSSVAKMPVILKYKDMAKFDQIRPFNDNEVNAALQGIAGHPMMKTLMNFTFSSQEDAEWRKALEGIHSTSEFQTKIIAETVRKILRTSAESLTATGFENLDKNKAYLFISNHRDIILDTSLLNLVLLDKGMVMTASAIGDNLVRKDFLNILAKLNRNFLVQRDLPIREQLSSSQTMSEYICKLLLEDNRSVWLAQREGRTKDGNDATQQGVLKMLAMAAGKEPLISFFKKLQIVPLSISYEYDPTDVLKMPALLAKSRNEEYVKAKNEDFNSMMSGVLGQKKRICLHAGKVLDSELDMMNICPSANKNQQLQAIANIIDRSILENYKLWPTNYIAYDLLNATGDFKTEYTAHEKQLFERRLKRRIGNGGEEVRRSILAMYANPVANKINLTRGSLSGC